MLSIDAATVKGRLFDDHGRCNTPARPLDGYVEALRPGQWVIHVGLSQSLAYVDVLVDRADLDAESTTLQAWGLLYSDELQNELDDTGHLRYDHANQPVRRAPMVVSGRFEGAFLSKEEEEGGYRIRIDCAKLLPFYLEFPVSLTQ
jgi:hypothetical protein